MRGNETLCAHLYEWMECVSLGLPSLCHELTCIHPLPYTAVIPPPELQIITKFDSVAKFSLGEATALRSERYISSLERTDLGVPLEVEFEEMQSVEDAGDVIEQNVSVPGVVYNIQIWSINGASFSYDTAAASSILLSDTGNIIANIGIMVVYYASPMCHKDMSLIPILPHSNVHMYSPLCSSTAVCHPHPL